MKSTTRSCVSGMLFAALLCPAVGCLAADETNPEVTDTEETITLALDSVISDIQIVASDNSQPPPGPSGYALLGYWDVDGGGALGTNGSHGSYMSAMYARFVSRSATSTCVTDVHLQASNSSTLPPNLAPNLIRRGYWDVGGGGAVGANGSSGSYMTGLYTSSAPTATSICIVDARLVASDLSVGPCIGGYDCAGYWDVDGGGGVGANGSTGSYMMALSTLSQ